MPSITPLRESVGITIPAAADPLLSLQASKTIALQPVGNSSAFVPSLSVVDVPPPLSSPPPELLLLEAILKAGHMGWYRQQCSGSCPPKCPFLSLPWATAMPVSLLSNAIHSHLEARIMRCSGISAAATTTTTIIGTTTDISSGGMLPLIFQRKKRLCALHNAQAAWRKRGSSCAGECCLAHDWPEKESAPLLHLPHLSPRQAVVLLHFGLLTEANAREVVTWNAPLAKLVVHLLHNKGCRLFFFCMLSAHSHFFIQESPTMKH